MNRVIFIDSDRKIELNSSGDVVLVGFDGVNVDVLMKLNDGCNVNLYALFVLDGKTHLSLNTYSDHVGKESKSRVLVKTVASGQSVFNYKGLINIENGAVNSDGYLKNENLVLSDEVKINSSPQLEIKNDLVKASHGVVTSTIDFRHLNYLMSRGLSEKDATMLIVNGFAESIAKMLPLDLYEKLQKRLSSFF